MWGVGASVSLPKPIVLLPRAAAVFSSSVNGVPTTSASKFDLPASSTPRATPKQQIKIQGQQQQQQQQRIVGSDIVMALQRAAAEKNKKNLKMAMAMKKKKKAQGRLSLSSSSGDIQSGEEEVAEETRPIRINGDWATRLDHLETRLIVLSRSI